MKRIFVVFTILTILFASCSTPSQSWQPKAGQKMRKGHNRR